MEKEETDKPVLDVVEAEQAPVEETNSAPDIKYDCDAFQRRFLGRDL